MEDLRDWFWQIPVLNILMFSGFFCARLSSVLRSIYPKYLNSKNVLHIAGGDLFAIFAYIGQQNGCHTLCITMVSHERHGVSNHQQLNCLLNSLFRLITKKIPRHCITNTLQGESTSGLASQRASNDKRFNVRMNELTTELEAHNKLVSCIILAGNGFWYRLATLLGKVLYIALLITQLCQPHLDRTGEWGTCQQQTGLGQYGWAPDRNCSKIYSTIFRVRLIYCTYHT